MQENTYQPRGRRTSTETLRIQALREKKGMSIEELSRKSGISAEDIEAFESHRLFPSVEVTEILAAVLEVSYEQLMGIDLTGYPSVDRPWKQYYEQEAYTTALPQGNIYNEILRRNQGRMKESAIEYVKTKISYGQMFDYIEKARNSFLKLGLGQGDIVSIILPNIPENVYCLYALNRIGAICNMVDLRLSGEKLIESIQRVGSRIVVCSDVFAENIAAIQDQVQVEKWIVLSPYDSVPVALRGFLKMKNKKPAVKEIRNRLSWNEFLRLGIGLEAEDYPGKTEDVACIFHTSGTTAMPKSVMMTNGNMNALGFSYEHAPVETREKDRFLSHIPPFVAYNTIFTIHVPLMLRMTVVMIPFCPVDEFADMILQYKPNHVAGSAALWREFLKNPKIQDADFSYLRGMATGNDVLSLEAKEELNQILAKGGCQYKILEGYGMTEAGSAVCSCWPNINPEGTIGIPLCCNVLSIFDPDNPDRELTYGESGEICLQGPTLMAGYYHDPATTSEVLKKHKDGKIWLHSGDLGFMDEEGIVTFKGRFKRTIVTHKGFKIAPKEIEQVIMKAANVDACCVVGQPDTDYGAGQIPVAFLVLKDPSVETVSEVKRIMEETIQPDYQVSKYRVIEKLPLTPNDKIDFRLLENMTD